MEVFMAVHPVHNRRAHAVASAPCFCMAANVHAVKLPFLRRCDACERAPVVRSFLIG